MVWEEPKEKINQKVMIRLILDRSGSMEGKEKEVVGGVNEFLNKQRQLDGEASIGIIRFDSESIETFRKVQSIKDIKNLTLDDYKPRAMTPLLDAIGKTLKDMDFDWVTEKPDKAICVIVTDGYENASKEFNKIQIKRMIEDRQDSKKWSFIYLGADVNTFSEAASYGFWKCNTAFYVNSGDGASMIYSSALSNAVYHIRSSQSLCADNLGGNIGENGSITK